MFKDAVMVLKWHLVATNDRTQLLSIIDDLQESGIAGSGLVTHEAHHLKYSITNIVSPWDIQEEEPPETFTHHLTIAKAGSKHSVKHTISNTVSH